MSGLPESLELPVGKRTLKYRFFEMLPGLLSWSLLIFVPVISFLDKTSLFAAGFILLFMISWFYRAVGMAFRTLQGYKRMKNSETIPWLEWLNHLENPEDVINKLQQKKALSSNEKVHLENLTEYVKDAQLHDLRPSDLLQLIIIPLWREGYEVLAPTIQSFLDSNYPNKQMILVLAYEERGGEEPIKTTERLLKEFGDKFLYATRFQHVDGPNEVVGKGGNVTYAAKQIMPYFKQHHIDPARVMVSTFDADNKPHKDYLAHLSYSYILTHDRKHRSYQPLALYTNNIWDVPAPMRVLAVGNSFFTIVQSVRPHLLRNFSSHSQPLDGLLETSFWSTRSIVEDGHQFWRSYFRFGGNHSVVPIYSPNYQDAVLSDTYRATLKAQFIQLRRWAYGASDIAYISNLGFRRKKDRIVPLHDFLPKFLRLLDTHVSWATAAILLLVAPRIPLLVGRQVDKSIVAYQLPVIASYAQTLALGGLFVSIFLSMKLLPRRPERYKRHRTVLMLAQWVLLPFTSIIYGAGAGLYSQTRLLLGKYLDKFDLTHKGIKAPKGSKSA